MLCKCSSGLLHDFVDGENYICSRYLKNDAVLVLINSTYYAAYLHNSHIKYSISELPISSLYAS